MGAINSHQEIIEDFGVVGQQSKQEGGWHGALYSHLWTIIRRRK